MTLWDDVVLLVSRLFLAGLFLGGTVQKLLDPMPAQAMLSGAGWPPALIWLAALFTCIAGMALMFGLAVRPVALALAGYCLVTSWFHWIPADPWQISIFVKNWAIAGGCLALSVAGAGRLRLRTADLG